MNTVASNIPDTRSNRQLLKRYLNLIAPYFYSKNKVQIRKWSVSLLILIILQMGIAILVTGWTAGTFNALELRSVSGILTQLIQLIGIFIGSIVVSTAHTHVKRSLQIGLRKFLTQETIQKWLHDGAHAKLLQNPTSKNDNPDGRLSSDCRAVADGFIELSTGLLYNILATFGFTAVLWSLSSVVTIGSITISGILVWVAILYAISASILGYFASKSLTSTTNDLNSCEADLRLSLVEAKENCGRIGFQGEEAREAERLFSFFDKLRESYCTQTEAWKRIVKFGSGYGVLNMAIPILVSSPGYIIGKLTLGGLMQSAQAFGQLVCALSWPVNSMAGIAIWRASADRVLSLTDSIDELDSEDS